MGKCYRDFKIGWRMGGRLCEKWAVRLSQKGRLKTHLHGAIYVQPEAFPTAIAQTHSQDSWDGESDITA